MAGSDYASKSELQSAVGKLTEEMGFGRIIGQSAPILALIRTARLFAQRDSAVLIEGETGTGKELVAKAIHYCSRRAAGPFVAINCGAVPADLFEHEFFGSVAGAFTGARNHPGLFEQAHGGSLFLDEVNSLAIANQPKLLRTLETHEVRRLGDTVSRKVNVRVISAANCNFKKEAEAGRFRSDLFYRLHILTLRTPPLRERREDIPLVANHYLDHLVSALEASNSSQPEAPELFAVARSFSPPAMMKLMNFSWPGNIRELQNVIEKAVALAAGPAIEPQDLDFSAPPSKPAGESLLQQKNRMVHDFMQQKLEEILSEHHWNYKESAQACGMDRRSLYALAVKHHLNRPRIRTASSRQLKLTPL